MLGIDMCVSVTHVFGLVLPDKCMQEAWVSYLQASQKAASVYLMAYKTSLLVNEK